jgi:hypothetical protein
MQQAFTMTFPTTTTEQQQTFSSTVPPFAAGQRRHQNNNNNHSVPVPKSVQMMMNNNSNNHHNHHHSSSSLPPPPPPPPQGQHYNNNNSSSYQGTEYYNSNHHHHHSEGVAPSYYSSTSTPPHAQHFNNNNNAFNNKQPMNGYSRRQQQQQQNQHQANNNVDDQPKSMMMHTENSNSSSSLNNSPSHPNPAGSGTIEVYGFNNVALYTIPREDIISMPSLDDPSNSQIKNLQLCPNFDAKEEDVAAAASSSSYSPSCVNGAACKFAHARLDKAQRQEIHVNYAYATLDDVCYESFPLPSQILQVAPPNASVATDEIPSHLVLKTAALQSSRRVISHCAHYFFNRVCNRGPECYFIHAISLMPLQELLANSSSHQHNAAALFAEQNDESHPLYGFNRRTWGRTQTKKSVPANVVSSSGNGTGTTTPIPFPLSSSSIGASTSFNSGDQHHHHNHHQYQPTSYGQQQQGGPLAAFAGQQHLPLPLPLPVPPPHHHQHHHGGSGHLQTGSYPLSRTDSIVFNKNANNSSTTPPSGMIVPAPNSASAFGHHYINNGGSTQNLTDLERHSDEDSSNDNDMDLESQSDITLKKNNNQQQQSQHNHLSTNKGMPPQQLSASNLAEMSGSKKNGSNQATPYRRTHNPYSMTNPVVRSYNGSPVTPVPPPTTSGQGFGPSSSPIKN